MFDKKNQSVEINALYDFCLELESGKFYDKYNEQQFELSKFCYNNLLDFLKNNTQLFNLTVVEIEDFIKKVTWDRLFGPHRVLGGYFTPRLAETLNINDIKVFHQVSYANFLARFWFILRDYRLDEPNIVKDFFLLEKEIKKEAIKKYLEVIPKNKKQKIIVDIDNLYRISKEANKKDIIRRKKMIRSYNSREINVIGEKIAIVNRTTYTLGYYGKKKITNLLLAIEKILTMIQINHDLTDFEEDFKIKNFTLPMTLAIKSVANKLPISFSKIEDQYFMIKKNFYSKKVLGSTIKRINNLGKKALLYLRKYKDNPFSTHINIMVRRNSFLINKLGSNPDIVEIQEILKKNQGHPNLHNIIYKNGDQY